MARIRALADPRKAVTFARQGDVSGSDNVPAILWLSLALIALWSVKNGRLPDPKSGATLAVAVGAIVLLGSVVPRLVVWALLALLVAASIGAAPQLAALIAQIQATGVSLSLNPGAQTNGA